MRIGQIVFAEFQSLKGFQRLWIQYLSEPSGALPVVSIPKRVSEALNLPDLVGIRDASKIVSIPKRVSEALNQIARGKLNLLTAVSIPKRVSEALNHWVKQAFEEIMQLPVSIPKRVSEALNHSHKPLLLHKTSVSIPKRVSEALNPGVYSKHPWRWQFQSLKGFQRLWIIEPKNDKCDSRWVSIPKRVSEALNPRKQLKV